MKILPRTSFSHTLLIICRSLGIKSVAIYITFFFVLFLSVGAQRSSAMSSWWDVNRRNVGKGRIFMEAEAFSENMQ